MNWLWYLLCGLFLLDGLRLRAKFRSLPILSRSGKPDHTEYVCLALPGLAVPEATIAAAAEYAESRGLQLLDLVPSDAPALELMRMFYRVDPGNYGTNRIAPGHTTGYCLLVSRDVINRCGLEKPDAPGNADLYPLARLFKKYAINRVGIVVAPDLKTPQPGNGTEHWPVFSEFMRQDALAFLLFQVCVLLTLLSCLVISPGTGLVLMAAYQVQVLLVFAGQKVKPRDLLRAALFRIVLDVRNLFSLAATRIGYSDKDEMEVRELRAEYTAELANGVERFFEKRRDDCPVCGGKELKAWIQTTDVLQHKPGRFTLERCSACGHIFQNPRLSLVGLEFYYRDFYDGLGAGSIEQAFQRVGEDYRSRAEAVRRLAQPARWLDVGAAHGHFCCYAKSLFPNTEFDGLDMSYAIIEAARMGWVKRGFQGLFPELAPRLSGQYDVVSIFHCLEHALEPAEEIRAAHTVLNKDGLLIIEVPNPESWLGRLFGRFWMAWLQPQHLNMYSAGNLGRLLRQNGFEPMVLEGSHVQQQCDFSLATVMFFKWIAPRPGMPWNPHPSPFLRFRRVAWVLGLPVLLMAGLADLAFAPIAKRLKIANSYRLLARRIDCSDPAILARTRSDSRELKFQ